MNFSSIRNIDEKATRAQERTCFHDLRLAEPLHLVPHAVETVNEFVKFKCFRCGASVDVLVTLERNGRAFFTFLGDIYICPNAQP